MWLLACVLLLLLTAALLKYVTQRRMRDAVANISGPYCLPLLGAVHMFFDLNPSNFLKRGNEYRQRYGRIMRVWALGRLIVVSGDVELNEQILTSQRHIVKQRNYKMLRQWLGTGLLLSDGRKWFARRKIITPAFHFKILEQFVVVFDRQSTVLLRCLAERADGRCTFDVYPFICLAALDIIAETAMGTKVNAQTNSRTQYAAAVNKMTKLMAWRFMKLHLNSELLFTILYPHLKWRQMQLIKTMHEFTTKVIKQRRDALEEDLLKASSTATKAQQPDDLAGYKQPMALLDVLLQSFIDGAPLSNEDIREEVDTFMFEGHDTTTSALCFALHLIARHPEVQARILAEVRDVLGENRTDAITLHKLNELKYIECVIKETLRLYPSVPIIGRQLEEDFKYTHSIIGDGIIPAGTEFLILVYGMLRDPRRFEAPNQFLPERHLNHVATNAIQMVPFSAGPRNCIGQKFAMLEMKTVIAKVVREYELLPYGADVERELNIVMRSSTGFQLGMKKRA